MVIPAITVSIICVNLLFSSEVHAEVNKLNFVAVGDLGCTSHSNQTFYNIIDKKPEIFLALGDIYYECKPDEFRKIFSPLIDILYLTLGNHDSWSKLAGLYHLPIDRPYYSFDKENVHFLSMSTESDREVNSTQYHFVETDLDIASNNESIDWIVVLAHRPFISSDTKNLLEKENLIPYSPLFAKYGVDVVIQAHVHNYQRTFPILLDNKSYPMIVTTNSTINEGNGVVYVIAGGGGHDLFEFKSKSPYVQTQYSNYGILNVDVNENSLTLTAYTNKDFKVPKDTFTILKTFNNTQPTPLVKYFYLQTIDGNGTIPTPRGLIEIPFQNGTARFPVEYNYSLPN